MIDSYHFIPACDSVVDVAVAHHFFSHSHNVHIVHCTSFLNARLSADNSVAQGVPTCETKSKAKLNQNKISHAILF